MSKETLLELRQLNHNTHTIANGDYVCTLGETVSIKKGDQINVKNIFIDTLNQESNKIVIPPEHSNLTVHVGLYLVDQDSTVELCKDRNTYIQPEANDDDGASNTRPNGKTYYLASADTIPPDGSKESKMITFTGFAMRDIRGSNIFRYRDEVMKAYLLYKDVYGKEHSYFFSVKKKEWRKRVPQDTQITLDDASTEYYVDAPALPIQVLRDAYGSGKHMRMNPNQVNKEGTGIQNFKKGLWEFLEVVGVQPVPENSTTYTPWTFPITVKIGDPKQPTSYTKPAFARHLTDKLSFAAQSLYIDNDTYCDNRMLQSKTELKKRGACSDKSKTGTLPSFVATDNTDILTPKDSINYLYGASTFSVGYDPEIDVFSLDAIHSSIYTGNNKSIVPIAHNEKKFILNKTGGIYLSDCSWRELFTDEMQLPSSIFVNPVLNPSVSSIGSLNNISLYKMSLQDGLNVTGEINTMDSLVVKESNPYISNPDTADSQTYDQAFGFQSVPDIVGKQQYKGVLQTQQVSIIGGTKPPDTLDNAYYQLEIDANYNIDKYSNDINSKKICAIVSKYYSTDNYTVGDSSMGLVYEHLQDEPMLLKNFRVRILNPDNSICDPLKVLDDNTVFLSIISN